MIIIVTGSNGMLGSQMVRQLRGCGHKVFGVDLPVCDITDEDSVAGVINSIGREVDYIINCAAFTDVPGADIRRSDAYNVNVLGPRVLSKICLGRGIHLIHFSTDFVFDGSRSEPYTELDTPNPIQYYGYTKMLGEDEIQCENTIFRLQWLFGHDPKTFFSKLKEKSKLIPIIRIVDYEFGSPCSVDFVSQTVCECLGVSGLFHLTHNNYCSRFECAKYFLDKIGYKGELRAIPLGAIEDIVPRPEFGVMSNKKLTDKLGLYLGTWQDDINAFYA